MMPKKPIKLYEQLAEETGLPQSFIENTVEFYYKTLRKHLTDLDDIKIKVDHLGYFTIKKGVVLKTLPKLETKLIEHDTSTYPAYFNKKQLEEKVEVLKKAHKKITELQKRKEEFKKTKK